MAVDHQEPREREFELKIEALGRNIVYFAAFRGTLET